MQEVRLKREHYDVHDAGFACMMFVLLTTLFVFLYSSLPVSIRSIAIVGLIASFVLEFLFAAAGYLTAKSRNVDFFKATTLNKKPTGKIVCCSFLIALISIIGFSSLSNLFIMAIESIGYKTSLDNVIINNFGEYIAYLIVMCAAPAIFEEICFRGTICAGLKSKNKHMAVFVSALIFTIMHGGPEQTIHQLILGIVFGYIFVFTNNIWITIFIHFFNNAIAVTMMYIDSFNTAPSVEETLPQVGFQGFSTAEIITSVFVSIILAVIAAILIYLLVKYIMKHQKKMSELSNKLNEINGNSQDEDIIETDTKTQVVESKETKKAWIPTLIYFGVSCMYLVFQWLLTFINGFHI